MVDLFFIQLRSFDPQCYLNNDLKGNIHMAQHYKVNDALFIIA